MWWWWKQIEKQKRTRKLLMEHVRTVLNRHSFSLNPFDSLAHWWTFNQKVAHNQPAYSMSLHHHHPFSKLSLSLTLINELGGKGHIFNIIGISTANCNAQIWLLINKYYPLKQFAIESWMWLLRESKDNIIERESVKMPP